MQPLKVAIVGTGRVAQGNYLPCLAADGNVSLGYYNRTRARAEACAAQFGGLVFDSLAELMAWEPDTVFVLTREQQRGQVLSDLLPYQPRRLFLEKPLVAAHGQEQVSEEDFQEGRRLMQMAQSQGCETAMIFNYRFFDQVLAAKRIIAERQFGSLLNLTGLTHYACWSHCIDLIHHFAGPLAEVSALGSQAIHSAPGMAAADLTAAFRTEGDAVGSLIGTTTLAWQYPLFELTLNFAGGRVRLQDLDGEMEILDGRSQVGERYNLTRHSSRWDQYNASFRKSITAYLAAVRQGEPPPVPGRFGLMELQVEAGFKRSLAQGRPVKLAEEFPLG